MSRRSAVLFNATSESLSRTTDLPAITSFTITAWFQQRTARGGAAFSFGTNVGAPDYHYFAFFTSDGAADFRAIVWNGAVNAYSTTELIAGVWFHLALVVSGTGAGQCLGYLNGIPEMTTDGNASPTAAKLYIGNSPGNEWLNGVIADVRIWDAALSRAEIRAEMWAPKPIRSRALHAWHEFLPGRLTLDSSGRGRHLTTAGTPTTETGPPLPTLPMRRVVGKAPVAATSMPPMYTGLSQAILAR